MSAITIRDAAFLNRFQRVSARKCRVELGKIVLSSLLLALLGLGGLAVADYLLELARTPRVVALGTILAAVGAFGIRLSWSTMRRWSPPTTAAEIETAFHQLGQSVRTTVQFGTMGVEQYQSEGIATSLVAALAEQIHQLTLPLTIEDVIPTKRLWMMLAGVSSMALLLSGASGADWEWRNAIQRALLIESPYRGLDVRPGDQTVDEGAGTQIEVALIGRSNRDVVLFTRVAEEPGAEWTERTLQVRETTGKTSESTTSELEKSEVSRNGTSGAQVPKFHSSRPHLEFVARLDLLTKPIEYRITAGELESPKYRIDIRRPLRLDEIKIELIPPAYTGQPKSVTLEPNLNVLQGTAATFELTFDKPVKSAAIVQLRRPKPMDDVGSDDPMIVPMEPRQPGSDPMTADQVSVPLTAAEIKMLSVTLSIHEDCNYSITAQAVDGTSLPENKYRIRVREDQPPQVTIEEPDDAIEVHSLAELPMRIRVRDDYGLSRAGVIFQINNEQAIPLIAQDFAIIAAAANEFAETSKVSLTTQIVLEKVLPLEFFELTQKDSVMYFGFAEDNRPDLPQRTETDMRFIDIRPFKRTYQVIDPDPMTGMGGGLKTIEELIKRQRFALNRTLQIEKQAAVGRKPDASTLDQLMQFETDLAKSVRETAEGLLARQFDDVELFFQAETAMLAAVDSLSVGKWGNATLQMKDALKALIEQRDRTQLAILKNPNAAQLAALRAFDRLQAQKLRRPKTDKEEARDLIRRLQELIAEENTVAESLDDEPNEKSKSVNINSDTN